MKLGQRFAEDRAARRRGSGGRKSNPILSFRLDLLCRPLGRGVEFPHREPGLLDHAFDQSATELPVRRVQRYDPTLFDDVVRKPFLVRVGSLLPFHLESEFQQD